MISLVDFARVKYHPSEIVCFRSLTIHISYQTEVSFRAEKDNESISNWKINHEYV